MCRFTSHITLHSLFLLGPVIAVTRFICCVLNRHWFQYQVLELFFLLHYSVSWEALYAPPKLQSDSAMLWNHIGQGKMFEKVPEAAAWAFFRHGYSVASYAVCSRVFCSSSLRYSTIPGSIRRITIRRNGFWDEFSRLALSLSRHRPANIFAG